MSARCSFSKEDADDDGAGDEGSGDDGAGEWLSLPLTCYFLYR